MNKRESHLLSEVTDAARARLCIRTKTRIDVGLWWRPKRAWICVADDQLVMLAVARRRYVARKPLAEIKDSYYCHASGQLVIEPGEDLTFNRFRVTPREALQVLKEVKSR